MIKQKLSSQTLDWFAVIVYRNGNVSAWRAGKMKAGPS
jgi:hypothetical protein